MLRAFELGGDFHSRTAMSMYDYVAKAVESGEVLLEAGDGSGGRQLLSKKFGSERRKAKVLNFSIGSFCPHRLVLFRSPLLMCARWLDSVREDCVWTCEGLQCLSGRGSADR